MLSSVREFGICTNCRLEFHCELTAGVHDGVAQTSEQYNSLNSLTSLPIFLKFISVEKCPRLNCFQSLEHFRHKFTTFSWSWGRVSKLTQNKGCIQPHYFRSKPELDGSLGETVAKAFWDRGIINCKKYFRKQWKSWCLIIIYFGLYFWFIPCNLTFFVLMLVI